MRAYGNRQVYRLLAKDSVDEHLEALLDDKRSLFQVYTHDSDAKKSHSSATDPRIVDYEIGGNRSRTHSRCRD